MSFFSFFDGYESNKIKFKIMEKDLDNKEKAF